MKRSEVYNLIDGERAYQDKLWLQNAAHAPQPLRIGEDLLLIEQYINLARTEWTSESRPEVKTMAIIRKIAGITVRSMEVNGAPPR